MGFTCPDALKHLVILQYASTGMKWIPISALILVSFLAPLSLASDRASHTNGILRGPYLQLATPNSMYVVWRTDYKIAPAVRFGLDPDNLDRQTGPAGVVTRYGTTNKFASLPEGMVRLHSAPSGCYQYEANLTNLT